MPTFVGYNINLAEKYQRDCTLANALQEAHDNYKPPFRKRLWAALKEIFPHTDWGIYATPSGRYIVIWKSWLGRKSIVFERKFTH